MWWTRLPKVKPLRGTPMLQSGANSPSSFRYIKCRSLQQEKSFLSSLRTQVIYSFLISLFQNHQQCVHQHVWVVAGALSPIVLTELSSRPLLALHGLRIGTGRERKRHEGMHEDRNIIALLMIQVVQTSMT